MSRALFCVLLPLLSGAFASSPADGGPPGSMELYERPGRFIQVQTAELSLALLVPQPECSGASIRGAKCQSIHWEGWGSAPRRLLAVQQDDGRLTLEEFAQGVLYRNGPYQLAAIADDEVLLLRPGLSDVVLGEVLRFGNGEAHLRSFVLTPRADCGPAQLAPQPSAPVLGRQVTFLLRDCCGVFSQAFNW